MSRICSKTEKTPRLVGTGLFQLNKETIHVDSTPVEIIRVNN